MKTDNWPGFKTFLAPHLGCPDMRDKTRPDPARRYLSFFLPLLAIFLSVSFVEAQEPSPRASAAAAIAAQRLQVPEAELEVVNEAQIGKEFNSIKVFHPPTGQIEVVNLDTQNREAPRERVEQVLTARRQAGFRGKLEKQLADRVARRPATELTTVVVWMRLLGPPPRLERPSTSAAGSIVSIEEYHEFHRKATHGLVKQAEAQGWTVVYQSEEAPVVILEVPGGKLKALEARGDVEAVYLSRQYRPELDISTEAIGVKGTEAATQTQGVWLRGFTGAGVKIAVVEGNSIYFDHSYIPDGTYCNPGTVVVDSHPTGAAGIIASTHPTYRGVAYGAPPLLNGNLTNGTDGELMKCTDWAINQGAKVINYSFGEDATDPYFKGSDRYVDYVIRNRGVTIVKSAGNSPSTNNPGTCFSPNFWVTSPGKGYNVLTVGAYNDVNTVPNTDDVMHATSCWGNPASPHGDRQKPEVVAPGYLIYTTTTGSPTSFRNETGTSFAAPHVTGCVALLMQYNTALQGWPEAVRAVLMASALTNIEGDKRLSEQDGAGGIECAYAHDILRATGGGEQHMPVGAGNLPMDFTFSTAAGRTVRAVIAWDSTTAAPVSSTTPPASDPVLNADIDLQIFYNGTLVTGSYSYDNSYEIVEFTAPYTGTYTARVYATRFDGPSEYLAFAWWQGVRVDQ